MTRSAEQGTIPGEAIGSRSRLPANLCFPESGKQVARPVRLPDLALRASESTADNAVVRVGRIAVLFAVAAVLVASVASAKRAASPNGRVLAFLRESGVRPASPVVSRAAAVMEVDVETGRERVVRRIHLRGHNWSPDGGELAFITGSSLFVLDLDGGRVRRVFRGAIGWRRAPSGRVAVPPAWSPDVRKLVVEGSFRGRRGLVLVDARGRRRPRLLVAARTRGGFGVGLPTDARSPTASQSGRTIRRRVTAVKGSLSSTPSARAARSSLPPPKRSTARRGRPTGEVRLLD
jgi:hypothetical protein